MTELLWIFPILASIALILGGCRGETMDRILSESGKSFLRLVVGIFLLCVLLQAVLWVVPLFY